MTAPRTHYSLIFSLLGGWRRATLPHTHARAAFGLFGCSGSLIILRCRLPMLRAPLVLPLCSVVDYGSFGRTWFCASSRFVISSFMPFCSGNNQLTFTRLQHTGSAPSALLPACSSPVGLIHAAFHRAGLPGCTRAARPHPPTTPPHTATALPYHWFTTALFCSTHCLRHGWCAVFGGLPRMPARRAARSGRRCRSARLHCAS